MSFVALRSVFFVALDENDMAVKRMQSFAALQPGEVASCAGCHEHRAQSENDAWHRVRKKRHGVEGDAEAQFRAQHDPGESDADGERQSGRRDRENERIAETAQHEFPRQIGRAHV